MTRRACWSAAALTLLLGCGQPDAGQPAATTTASAHADSTASLSHDPRTLRAIMQRLDANMVGLTHDIAIEDYAAMTVRTAAIAGHADMSAAEVQRIERVLAQDMPTFEAADARVHQAARRMHDAASAHDVGEVARQYGEVQRGCVSCHSTYRARLRTAPTAP